MGWLFIWPSGAAILVGIIAFIVNLFKCFGQKKAPKKILLWPILLFFAGIVGFYLSGQNFIYI